jgi:hypothetical protein
MKIATFSFAIAVWILPVSANAQLTIEMASIKCEQYLAMSPSQSRNFSSWMSGWFSYQTNRTSVDLLAHQKNIATVKTWCKYRPKETVMSGLQNATGTK